MFSYGSGLTSTMFSLRLNNGQHPFSLSNIASVLDVTEKLQSRHEVSPSHSCLSFTVSNWPMPFSIYPCTVLTCYLLPLATRPCLRNSLRHWSWWNTDTAQRTSRRAETRACCSQAHSTSPRSTPCTGGSIPRSWLRKQAAAKPSAATASQMATSGARAVNC